MEKEILNFELLQLRRVTSPFVVDHGGATREREWENGNKEPASAEEEEEEKRVRVLQSVQHKPRPRSPPQVLS